MISISIVAPLDVDDEIKRSRRGAPKASVREATMINPLCRRVRARVTRGSGAR